MMAFKYLLKATAWRILVQQSRNRIVSRNPSDPHFDRKKMLEVCKPIYWEDKKPEREKCSKTLLKLQTEVHPYAKLLSEDLKKDWFSSRMICFYHINPVPDEERKKIRNMFYKKNLFFHIYHIEVVKLVLENSPFSSVLHLFESPTAMIFAAEPEVATLLKLSKKTSYITLLGGIVDGVFLSRNQLENFSKLPNIEVMHQHLSSLLQSAASNISGAISYQTQLLSYYLKQRQEEGTNQESVI